MVATAPRIPVTAHVNALVPPDCPYQKQSRETSAPPRSGAAAIFRAIVARVALAIKGCAQGHEAGKRRRRALASVFLVVKSQFPPPHFPMPDLDLQDGCISGHKGGYKG